MTPPVAGDIAWVDFGDTLGSEQKGRRPALILTPLPFHEISTRAVVCPVTSTIRNWPTEVRLPDGLKIAGVVLVDQIRSVDRTHRMFGVIDHVPQTFLIDVLKSVATLLNFRMADDNR